MRGFFNERRVFWRNTNTITVILVIIWEHIFQIMTQKPTIYMSVIDLMSHDMEIQEVTTGHG